MTAGKIKKGQGETWWVIVGAIIVLIIAGIVLFIVPSGIFKQSKNVDYLSSCENQKGHCKPAASDCQQGTSAFLGYGCPKTQDGKDQYCCIPSSSS